MLCSTTRGAAGLIASAADPVTYGRAEGAAYRVGDIEPWEAGVRFTVTPAEPAPDGWRLRCRTSRCRPEASLPASPSS